MLGAWSSGQSRYLPDQAANWRGHGRLSLVRPYRVTNLGDGPVKQADITDEDPIARRQRCEAVLFLSKTPLSTRKLAQLAHLADGTEARTLVRELNEIYQQRGRSLRIELVAGGYQMLTHASLARWLTRLGHLPPVVRLSSPMMETLAVVAYRQPVSRANVEAVRGVACGELLRQLMERDLIRVSGRSEELGRPYLYGTTKHFLQLFGLRNLDALPPIRWQALTEETPTSDSSQHDSSTTMKESLVSNTAASGLSNTDSELAVMDPADDQLNNPSDPAAVIEDEENEAFEETWEDEEEEDWGDEDDDFADDDDDSDEEYDDDDEDDGDDEDWDEEEGDEEDWSDEDDDEEDWGEEDDEDGDDEDWEEVDDEALEEDFDDDDDDDDEDWGEDDEEEDWD